MAARFSSMYLAAAAAATKQQPQQEQEQQQQQQEQQQRTQCYTHDEQQQWYDYHTAVQYTGCSAWRIACCRPWTSQMNNPTL
jgi:hypothetical protein